MNQAKQGDCVKVHYRGSFENGKVFERLKGVILLNLQS